MTKLLQGICYSLCSNVRLGALVKGTSAVAGGVGRDTYTSSPGKLQEFELETFWLKHQSQKPMGHECPHSMREDAKWHR